MPAAFRADPDAVCAACGCLGAFRFAGETLCGDCYAERSATCCADKPDPHAPANTPSIPARTRPLLATQRPRSSRRGRTPRPFH